MKLCLNNLVWKSLEEKFYIKRKLSIIFIKYAFMTPQLPDLVRTATQIATFKAGDKRKTTHQHLFLPKDYSGSPTASVYTEWSKEEAEAYLTEGWGEGAITEFNLEYLYGPEPEVSGE